MKKEKLVKTGFLMPVAYSLRAQKIAASKGMSMRSLLVEAIGIGLQSLDDSMQPVSVPVVTASPAININDMSELLSELAKLVPAQETQTAPPRHKPTKPAAGTWRFR